MSDDSLIRVEGRAGRVTLNRPKALNALTHQMCLDLEQALLEWAVDDAVSLVLVDATGDRAFCAGGDIVGLYQSGREGDFQLGRDFWRDEYRLNALIDGYAKPYVVVMDGFVMGGGVGVSAHGSHRIVTERTQFALPECGIGLIPDVGGSWLLAQMPGATGLYAGLTGARLNGADCIWAGLAEHYVTSDKVPALVEKLVETGNPAVIANFATDPPASALASNQAEIDGLFNAGDLMTLEAGLQAATSEIAAKALKAIHAASPLSIAMAFETLKRARQAKNLAEVLHAEYRAVCLAHAEGDFLEGIRAKVIDRDNAPNWLHGSLAEVPADLLAKLNTPVTGGDLNLGEGK